MLWGEITPSLRYRNMVHPQPSPVFVVWQGHCGREWRDIAACSLWPLPKTAEPVDLRTEWLLLHSLSLFYFLFLMQVSWRSSFGLESIPYLSLLHLICEELHCSVCSQVFLEVQHCIYKISPPVRSSVFPKGSGRVWRCLYLTSVIPVGCTGCWTQKSKGVLEKTVSHPALHPPAEEPCVNPWQG